VNRKAASPAGFTLVEVMIASAMGAVIMASVLSSYVFIARNLARLSSYQSLENESRKALTYLSRDFMLAQAVKSGTTPTESTVTLVLPAGEVVYTYSTLNKSLRRQATFGASPDLTFMRNDSCECTTFKFRYFTAADGAPTDQVTSTTNIPYSIKQIQVVYVVESPASWTAQTRTRFDMASSRYLFRNRGAPDGT
jgi:prepilin-type N-terminal cleavage/methylation domain-containing protein